MLLAFLGQGDIVEGLCYISRVPGAIITEETFDSAVQFDTVRADPLRRLLQDLTCLHAPPVALSTYKKTIKDEYSRDMHYFIACLTGEKELSGFFSPYSQYHLSFSHVSVIEQMTCIRRQETQFCTSQWKVCSALLRRPSRIRSWSRGWRVSFYGWLMWGCWWTLLFSLVYGVK